jgi:hypothetical protein
LRTISIEQDRWKPFECARPQLLRDDGPRGGQRDILVSALFDFRSRAKREGAHEQTIVARLSLAAAAIGLVSFRLANQ